MGILNIFFGSTESVAKIVQQDELQLIISWDDYKKTIPEKIKIINRLPASFGEKNKLILSLKKLLQLELIDISKSKKEDDAVVINLHSLGHDSKIKRIHKLDDCLKYYETRHEYVYELLRHLYASLKLESQLLTNLEIADLRKYRKSVLALQQEWLIEEAVVKKIDDLDSFKDIFSALVKGEHFIYRLDATERKIIKVMKKSSSMKGIIDRWVMGVFNVLEDKVHELVADGILEYHSNVDFEFVNRSEFITLVQEIGLGVQPKGFSEQEINAFVHLFREKYNSEM